MSAAIRRGMRAPLIVIAALATHAHAQAPGEAAAPPSGPPGTTTPVTPATPAMPAEYAEPSLTELDVETLAVPCRGLAKEANSKARVRALGARVSLASCLADAAMSGLQLIDGEESVLALEEALAPSRGLLDEVLALAPVRDAETRLVAQRAIATLYAGAASRMLQTVPPPVDGSDASQALRDIRLANVETMITPWRDVELKAHAEIVKLAAEHPRLARDRAYVKTIAASRARVGQPIATRP